MIKDFVIKKQGALYVLDPVYINYSNVYTCEGEATLSSSTYNIDGKPEAWRGHYLSSEK